jgi:hypothetical protein
VCPNSVLTARGTEGSILLSSASESILTGAVRGYRRKGAALAGSVSLAETRERDVLATSRLALAPFL